MDTMKALDEIEGVVVQSLEQIVDDRGSILHMLRSDSELFTQFGEIYFSEIRSGIIKAWKRHKKQTQNQAVPINKNRLVVHLLLLRAMVFIVKVVLGEAKAIGVLLLRDRLVVLPVVPPTIGVLLAVQAVVEAGVVIVCRRLQQVGAIGSVPAFRVFQLN